MMSLQLSNKKVLISKGCKILPISDSQPGPISKEFEGLILLFNNIKKIK